MNSDELAFEYLSKKYDCSFSYETVARNPIWQSEFYAFVRGFETCESKLKCCENCKYNSYWGDELHCNYGLKEALQEDKLVECKKMDKWEIKGE